MEKIDAPDAHGPYGITVVGIGEADKSFLVAISRRRLLVVLKGHLQGDFIRRGTIVREKNFG
jgi:hypothetical protein